MRGGMGQGGGGGRGNRTMHNFNEMLTERKAEREREGEVERQSRKEAKNGNRQVASSARSTHYPLPLPLSPFFLPLSMCPTACLPLCLALAKGKVITSLINISCTARQAMQEGGRREDGRGEEGPAVGFVFGIFIHFNTLFIFYEGK